MASNESTPSPEWAKTVVKKYLTGEGHAYLLYGPGIHDISALSYDLHANLYHTFGNKATPNKPVQLDFDIVVRYDRVAGFRFIGTEKKRSDDRECFKAIVEKVRANAPAGAANASGIRGGISGGISSAPKSDILEQSKNPALAIPLLSDALSQSEVRLCVILDEFQSICPRGDWDKIGEMFSNCVIAARSWGLDFDNIGGHGRKWTKAGAGHIIFGITDDKSEINSALAKGRGISGWIPVNVGFPSPAEREFYISEKVMTPAYCQQVDIDFGDNVAESDRVKWLAGATGGLSIRAIEDMRLAGDRHRMLNREMVQKIINETISEQFAGQGGSEYLTVINPTRGLRDYGFPAYLIEYMEWFLKQFRAGKLRNANILEAGPPGTGKSILAYALAYELGYKCVHWSPALTQSKWVGDSEKQTQQVLDWVEANLPCMVFIDEIDVALTSRDGGAGDSSGVGSKMLSILMPWLERDEIKGKLLLVGATNRADNIDAAMRRRLQTVLPILPPMTPEDRRAVLKNVLIREQGIDEASIEIPDDVVSDGSTKWYTQANLSILAEKAASIASRKDEDFSSRVSHFLQMACASYRVDTTRTEALSYLAASQSSDTDLLPPGFQVKQEREVKKILRDIESDDDEGVGPSERGLR